MAATYTYDANGNLTAKSGNADTPLRWNGQVQDTDTGLYYLRARYYDAGTGQFISRDPIEARTRQPYQYSAGDPINKADRSGLDAYHYSYDLGSLGTPQDLAGYTQANCSFLFPIAGCADDFQVGDSLPLHQDVVIPLVSFPVRVINVSKNSFEFEALPGHPEGEGRTITFSFCRDSDNNNKLHVDTSSEGSPLTDWWGLKDVNFAIAHGTWSSFADRIKSNFDYMMNDGYVRPAA